MKQQITREDILAYLVQKKLDFFSEYQLAKLGLFGSFAREEATVDSDIDLVIEFKPNTKKLSEKKAAMKAVLRKQFNREIDLCREKYIKSYYKSQILQSTIYV